MDGTGEFLGFFASNDVKKSLFEKLLDVVLTEEQLNKFLPSTPPSYGSIFTGADGLVYTLNKEPGSTIQRHSINGLDLVRRAFLSPRLQRRRRPLRHQRRADAGGGQRGLYHCRGPGGAFPLPFRRQLGRERTGGPVRSRHRAWGRMRTAVSTCSTPNGIISRYSSPPPCSWIFTGPSTCMPRGGMMKAAYCWKPSSPATAPPTSSACTWARNYMQAGGVRPSDTGIQDRRSQSRVFRSLLGAAQPLAAGAHAVYPHRPARPGRGRRGGQEPLPSEKARPCKGAADPGPVLPLRSGSPAHQAVCPASHRHSL